MGNTRSNLWEVTSYWIRVRLRPHGVIVGPDESPWIIDGGLNAIVRVDPTTKNVTVFRLPEYTGNATLNTATFDHKGNLWFTGQGGIYGSLDPNTGKRKFSKLPRGRAHMVFRPHQKGKIHYGNPEVYLAGVMKGHYNDFILSPIIDFSKKDDKILRELNLGIAVVTPCYLLKEILFSPSEVEYREGLKSKI